MRKSLFTIVAALMVVTVNAQVTQYDFRRESGIMTEVADYPGAQITNHQIQDDILSPAKIRMPFSFQLGGANY